MAAIKNIYLLVIYLIATTATAQYITVENTKTAQELIENVLINSTCANASGFFASGENSYAYFNAGSSNFPLKEGVILSTNNSKAAIGPFESNRGGGSKAWLGDFILDQTLGIKSVNATVLEFDFVSVTNFISFNYIFASNEYQSYFPCEYSDGFAFLIKEKDSNDPYKNIAVIPNTNTPVSSKDIHPTIASVIDTQNITHNGCTAVNETYFNGFNNNTSPINFSGQTVKLNAQADVIIGKTYHVKLVIADDKEEYFDSAIFLEAGSFSAKIDLGPDRSTTNKAPLCYGQSFTIDTKLPLTNTYKWYKDGATTPIVGEIKPSLTVTTAGTYKVKINFEASTCTAEDEIKIEYAPQIVLKDQILYQCDDDTDGLTIFDLTKMDKAIKNNDPKLSDVVYYTSKANAEAEINPIKNPASFKNTTTNQILYARVSNEFGCANYAELILNVAINTISPQNSIETCDTDDLQDGITQFDLNSKVTPQLINGLPNGLIIEYYLSSNDAITQTNQLPNLFTNTAPNQQIIYARIVNGPDCYNITPETLIIKTFDPPNFENTTTALCDGTNKILTVDSGYSNYLWSTGSQTNTTNITLPGTYSIIVTNTVNNCKKKKEYLVKPSGIATITNAIAINFSGSENSVSLTYSGNGNYEFSLGGNTYQDSSTFNRLNPGIYWATAKDKNGCGTSTPYKVYILDYPRFFTPNNDNYNDTWKIKNIEVLPRSEISIFDRYGKLLKQLNTTTNEWNGTFNGKELPADDYWFSIRFEDGKITKGHFSLKR